MLFKNWKYLVLILLTSIAPFLLTSFQNSKNTRVKLNLGDSSIYFVLTKKGANGPVLFNIHSNEKTSVKAAKKYLKSNSGTLVLLKNKGKRLVTFSLNGQQYRFDPNRMFTTIGVEKTLKKNGNYSEEAQTAVSNFANQVVQLLNLKPDQGIITLHNNTPNNLSIVSYLPNQSSGGEADSIYINEKWDVDDFYFVTDSIVFSTLKEKSTNVALQAKNPQTDDGSLSYYCGLYGIPYINIEAQHKHKQTQFEMINQITGSNFDAFQ